MSVIWIICPTTGKSVSTGIETDAVSFAALDELTLTLKCPACNAVHPWEEMQGYLVGDPPKYVQ